MGLELLLWLSTTVYGYGISVVQLWQNKLCWTSVVLYAVEHFWQKFNAILNSLMDADATTSNILRFL
jgi:hypothetical protein